MKGVVFNLFEDFVIENWGEETYEEVLSASKLETTEPFVGPGTYPDSDLVEMLTQACGKLGVEPADALRAFGKFCFPKLAEMGKVFLEGHTHPKTFLKSVHDVIHVEVRKIYQHANPPEFTYEDPADDSLVMMYRSNRKLCAFMEGLLEATGDHFGVSINYEKTSCQLSGDERCSYNMTFGPAKAVAAQ